MGAVKEKLFEVCDNYGLDMEAICESDSGLLAAHGLWYSDGRLAAGREIADKRRLGAFAVRVATFLFNAGERRTAVYMRFWNIADRMMAPEPFWTVLHIIDRVIHEPESFDRDGK